MFEDALRGGDGGGRGRGRLASDRDSTRRERGDGGCTSRWGISNQLSDSDYFRMGAAVAVGELYSAGDLGDRAGAADRVRSFLGSFGICSMADLDAIGLFGPYRHDFEDLLP